VRLCKSEGTEITFEAQRYLTSFYITSQRFEEAEEVLALLPDFDFNARHLRALLLYMKKDYEAAKKAAECVATYVDGMIHAEECLKESPFFGDLGEEIRFISNGALVSLEAFREELSRMGKFISRA